MASVNPETFKSDCRVLNSTTVPVYSKPVTAKMAVHKPVAAPSLPVEIDVSQVRVKDKEEKEREDFIPVVSDKSCDLDLEEFIPVSNSEYNIFT
jgi:hypothetical protein